MNYMPFSERNGFSAMEPTVTACKQAIVGMSVSMSVVRPRNVHKMYDVTRCKESVVT